MQVIFNMIPVEYIFLRLCENGGNENQDFRFLLLLETQYLYGEVVSMKSTSLLIKIFTFLCFS